LNTLNNYSFNYENHSSYNINFILV